MSWRFVVALALVVAASVGAAYIAVEKSKRDLREASRTAALQLRDSQLAGCERGIQDRRDAIRGWHIARLTRLATARNPAVAQGERIQAAETAGVYREVIAGLRSRLLNCSDAFPLVK